MLHALQLLEAPAHILGLASQLPSSSPKSGDRNQHSFLRYLHLRYLHVPDDGQTISNHTVTSWSTSLGVVPTHSPSTDVVAPAPSDTTTTPTSTPSPHFTPEQLLQLTQTVASMIVFDQTLQTARPHPSKSLMTAVAQDPNVFLFECPLFPFDLQWIVNAANAAPNQFTPSLDALQAELEQSQSTCTRLQQENDLQFSTDRLNDTLNRSQKASENMATTARATSKDLQEFSTLYRAQLQSAANAIKPPRLGHAGRISSTTVVKLNKITQLLTAIKQCKESVDRIQSSVQALETKGGL